MIGKQIQEEIPGNAVSSGAVAGIGIESPSLPNQAEPGMPRKKKYQKTIEVIKKIIRR